MEDELDIKIIRCNILELRKTIDKAEEIIDNLERYLLKERKDILIENITNMPIFKHSVVIRAFNQFNIRTVNDLININPWDLYTVRHFGKKTMNEIDYWLYENYGINWFGKYRK